MSGNEFKKLDQTQVDWFNAHPEDVKRTGGASTVLDRELAGDPFAGLPLTRGADVLMPDGKMYPSYVGTVANPFMIESADGSVTFLRPAVGADEEELYLRILAKCYLDLFRGGNDVEHYIHGEDGTEKGWYRTEPRGIEFEDFVRHLKGVEPSLLSIPIMSNGNCHFADGDVDCHKAGDTPVDYAKVARRIGELGLPLVLTRSRRDGGAHLTIFFQDSNGVPASIARALVAHYLRVLGLTGEVFPKQSDKPDHMGSGINLPYFGSSRVAFGDEGQELSLTEFLVLAAKRRSLGFVLADRVLGTSGPDASSPGSSRKDRPLPVEAIRNIHTKNLKTLHDSNELGHWNDWINKTAFWAARAFAAKALEGTELSIKDAIRKAARPRSGFNERQMDTTLDSGWDSGITQPLQILDPVEAHAEALEWSKWVHDEKSTVPDRVVAYDTFALLTPEEFEPLIKIAARRLGIRASSLEDFVDKRRIKKGVETSKGSNVIVEDTEAWDREVDGPVLMTEVSRFVRKFIVFKNPSDAGLVTLWSAGTHCYQLFNIFARLGIFAPKHDCGKSTLLEVAMGLVRRVVNSDNISTSSVFHLVENEHPTLVLDELDSFLKHNEELIGILKSGHKQGGKATRMEKINDVQVVVQYDTFCPVLYAMIAPPYPEPALLSRTIQLQLEPKAPGEKAEDFDTEENPGLIAELLVLRRKLARWTLDHAEHIRTCTPDMKSLINRNRNNWRPIFKLAEILGGEWPDQMALAAGVPPVRSKESDSMKLLSDIRNVFASYAARKKPIDGIPSTMLVGILNSDQYRESGWYRYRNNRDPLDEGDLAELLSGFEIEPKAIRLNKDHKAILESQKDVVKGYRLEWFKEKFARYLKPLVIEVPEEVSGQTEMKL